MVSFGAQAAVGAANAYAASAAGVAQGATAVNPLIGFAITLIAAFIDAKYTMPALMGDGKGKALPPRMMGVPTGPNDAGAPRIFAIGKRVRVPTHILWQSEKFRETSPAGKAGSGIVQRQVFIDALLSINDRKTKRLVQLIGNGTLLIQKSLNLVTVTSQNMTVFEIGGHLRIQVGSTEDPDLTDRIKVGDWVNLVQFANTGAGNVNVGSWKVSSSQAHTSIPGWIEVARASNQTITGMAANGGTAASPASVERIDDKLLEVALFKIDDADPNQLIATIGVTSPGRPPDEVFQVNDLVVVKNAGLSFNAGGSYSYADIGPLRIRSIQGDTIIFLEKPPWGNDINFAIDNRTATNPVVLEYWQVPVVGTDLFPPTYNPDDHFHDGSDDQGEDSLMVAALGTGNIPGYRGVACIALDDMKVGRFGDSLPFQLEAVADVDEGMTWQEAITVCVERGGVSRQFVNTQDVRARPFEGFFMRGALPGLTNLIPILLAGQIVTQDRNGVLCFFESDGGDVRQVENGELFSELGAYVGTPPDEDQVRFSNSDESDATPSSIGIWHQNPDNGYAEGYEVFGIRNPNAVRSENRRELDLSNLVLTKRQAMDLATTITRRTHVNSTIVEFTLPATALDLLEGDLVPFTYQWREFLCRVIQRDVGTNFLVRVTGLLEELDLAVTGSPVQSAAGNPPQILLTPPTLFKALVDMPPWLDSQSDSRGLLVTASAEPGSNWTGAVIFMSVDDESTWVQVGTLGSEGAIGVLATDLVAASPSETYGSSTITYDAVGVIAAVFINTGATVALSSLSSAPEAFVEAGGNWFAIINPDGSVEIVGVRDVTPLGANQYLFTTLLRGLRGTWDSCSRVHPAGSKIVLLTGHEYQNSAFFVPVHNALAGPAHFRLVPPGQSLSNIVSTSIVPTWRNCSPFDPRVLTKTISPSPFSARFTTDNWTRTNQPLGTLGPYPMDESFEAYRFTFWDATGNVIKRTKTITANGSGSSTLRDKWVDYPPAEQIDDGYTPSGSTSFYVAVQQLGDFGESRLIKRFV